MTTQNSSSSQFIVSLSQISKSYGKTRVLREIDLQVARGEVVAILGANGAGKTTLVEIIAGVLAPSAGKVHFSFLNHQQKNAVNIGIQFQSGYWPAGMRPVDILNFYQQIFPNVTQQHIAQLLTVFEIKDFLKKSLATLSGGQQQRFNAVLAVLHNPELIILDELTTGLDLQAQFKILDFFKKIIRTEQHTIILVSHIPNEIELLADRILLLRDGSIFADYPITTVREQFGSVHRLLANFFQQSTTEHD